MKNIYLLTYESISRYWLIIKTETLSEITEVGMLNNNVPMTVIHSVVEIREGDHHPPIFFIILLDMPMNSNRAHMSCAVNQGCCVCILS